MSTNIEVKEKPHVKFVSYTGQYPTLCHGVLTLNIDGVEERFGYDPFNMGISVGNYDCFWESGGDNYFVDGIGYSEKGDWKIFPNSLPDKYKKYAFEIEEVFNANVPKGCCGGCL